MRLPSLLIPSVAVLAMAALAPAAHAGPRPVCNAKHKRPANLHGSILSTGLKPELANGAPVAGSKTGEHAEATSPAAAEAALSPRQVSRAELRASFAPCGSDRA